jgi:6-phosphogluconolactonase (cycloisomerase 2 family)
MKSFLIAVLALICAWPACAGSIPPAVRYAFTANESDNSVSSYVVDSATGQLTLVSKVAAGSMPSAILANTIFPPGAAAYSYVYVLNLNSSTISEYSVSANGDLILIGTIATGLRPVALAVCGNYLYVTNYGYTNYRFHTPGNVSEYSIAADGTLTSIGTINAGTFPRSIATIDRSPYSSYVYVGSDGTNDVTEYVVGPTGALISTGTVATGAGPGSIDLLPSLDALYVASSTGINQYTINAATGALTPMVPATVASGTLPTSISVADGQSAYVATSFGVYQYAIGVTGALTALNPAFVAGGSYPRSVAVDAVGRYVYVSDIGGNNVFQYRIGSGGVLVANSPASVTDYPAPVGVSITYGGEVEIRPQYVYEVDNEGNVSLLSEASNGALTLVSTTPNPAPGSYSSALGIAVDPSGRYLYTYLENGEIDQYTIGAGGTPTSMTPAFAMGGNSGPVGPGYGQGSAIAVDPTGRYLYAVSCGNNYVSQFTIGSGGLLSAMATPNVAVGQCPSTVSVDASGKYVYVISMLTAQIFQFAIGGGGSLTALTPAWVVPYNWQTTMVLDPSGRFLYAADSIICQFDLSAGGLLSSVSKCAGTSWVISSMAVSPQGTYLYSVDVIAGTVAVFTIDPSSGNLTALSPVGSFSFGAGGRTSGVAVDPNGKYVYALKGISNSFPVACIAQFSVGWSGALTALSPPCVTVPNSPTKITTVGVRQ